MTAAAKEQLIAVVTSPKVGARVAELLARVLEVPVESRLHSGLLQLVDGLRDGRPDVVMFAGSGDESEIRSWLRENRDGARNVRFLVMACVGLDAESARGLDVMLSA